MATSSKVLGFDFGTRKIGVAAGQSITGTASPIAVLKAKDGQPDWDELANLVQRWKPDAFVVGIPYSMDDSENDMTAKARKFSRRLQERFGLPCHPVDERLSTREARDIYRSQTEARGHRYNDKKIVDAFSAQLIVESWLAANN